MSLLKKMPYNLDATLSLQAMLCMAVQRWLPFQQGKEWTALCWIRYDTNTKQKYALVAVSYRIGKPTELWWWGDKVFII